MQNNHMITPCLWFDDQAETAAQFYTSIFRNSKLVHISRLWRSWAGNSRKTSRNRHDCQL